MQNGTLIKELQRERVLAGIIAERDAQIEILLMEVDRLKQQIKAKDEKEEGEK